MKKPPLRLTFKCPDSVHDGFRRYCENNEIPDESEEGDQLLNLMDKFVAWRETVVIEIDVETGEARVVPVK